MKFNEKLLKLRREKGLSQEELGMEMQVSRQTVSKWEAGQSYPDFTRLVMLSDFFNMTLDELVKDTVATVPLQMRRSIPSIEFPRTWIRFFKMKV